MSYPIEKLENQMIDLIDEIYANSGLGRWFGKGGVGSSSGGGWDRYDSSGKKAGRGEKGDGGKGKAPVRVSYKESLQEIIRGLIEKTNS